MVVRDQDFNYFLTEAQAKYGATEEAIKAAASIRFSDKFSKETKQGPQIWNRSEHKWEDVPELVQVLSTDSDFGRVRFRRKTCKLELLDKSGKTIWKSSGK